MTGWSWVRDAAQCDARRADLRGLLGTLPRREGVLTGTRLDATTMPGVRVERWRLDLNGVEPVPALLTLPPRRPPRAVVLYCHAHGNRFSRGKEELLLGRRALAKPAYATVLAERGIAALAVDHWGFGERAGVSERLLNKRFLWSGRTLWGMRVADTLAAFDWLRAQPRFAALPVVTLGLSMGSTMAWWAAALEPRIDAVVDLCCLSEFAALVATVADDLHGEYFFVPGLFARFTAAEINALIAPRPHLSCAGARDPLTPPAGLTAIDAALTSAYAAVGAPSAWRQQIFNAAHRETPAMRKAVLAFLEEVVDCVPRSVAPCGKME